MRIPLLTMAILLFSSCESNLDLRPVDIAPLLHDSNSKVWLVDKVFVGDKNFAPKINSEKDVIIFYETGKCMFQPMRTLGDFPGKKGEFSIYPQERSLTLFFNAEKWSFKYETITEDSIVLIPNSESDLKYGMVLVPFPEL